MIGFLNLDKPAGLSAHDVVAYVRRTLGVKRVGHGGTLDPAATGVLPVGIGAACRLFRYLSGNKVYLAKILLGTRTTTDDLEGEVISTSQHYPEAGELREALEAFLGQTMQVPPLYSAVRHKGRRLYKLAREGKTANVPARQVTIDAIELVAVTLPVVQIRVACRSGTYIRALARDLGDRLSCGGCLAELSRERSGPFDLSAALSLDTLSGLARDGKVKEALIDPVAVLPYPRLAIERDQATRLAAGQAIAFSGQNTAPAAARPGREGEGESATCDPFSSSAASKMVHSTEGGLVVVLCQEKLIAVCRLNPAGKLQPEVVVVDGNQVD